MGFFIIYDLLWLSFTDCFLVLFLGFLPFFLFTLKDLRAQTTVAMPLDGLINSFNSTRPGREVQKMINRDRTWSAPNSKNMEIHDEGRQLDANQYIALGKSSISRAELNSSPLHESNNSNTRAHTPSIFQSQNDQDDYLPSITTPPLIEPQIFPLCAKSRRDSQRLLSEEDSPTKFDPHATDGKRQYIRIPSARRPKKPPTVLDPFQRKPLRSFSASSKVSNHLETGSNHDFAYDSPNPGDVLHTDSLMDYASDHSSQSTPSRRYSDQTQYINAIMANIDENSPMFNPLGEKENSCLPHIVPHSEQSWSRRQAKEIQFPNPTSTTWVQSKSVQSESLIQEKTSNALTRNRHERQVAQEDSYGDSSESSPHSNSPILRFYPTNEEVSFIGSHFCPF